MPRQVNQWDTALADPATSCSLVSGRPRDYAPCFRDCAAGGRRSVRRSSSRAQGPRGDGRFAVQGREASDRRYLRGLQPMIAGLGDVFFLGLVVAIAVAVAIMLWLLS